MFLINIKGDASVSSASLLITVSPDIFRKRTLEKICLKINGDDICSWHLGEAHPGFEITDDTVKFTGLQEAVTSIEMVVDTENGGIQMSNMIVLYTGYFKTDESSSCENPGIKFFFRFGNRCFC